MHRSVGLVASFSFKEEKGKKKKGAIAPFFYLFSLFSTLSLV
jgi:hypothetical protein